MVVFFLIANGEIYNLKNIEHGYILMINNAEKIIEFLSYKRID